jgi:hypothetical protein
MKKTIILLSAVISFTANAQWSLTGNAGTNPGNDFIGTTDNQPLVFKTNNQEWIKLTTTGRVIFQNIDGGLGWNNNLFLGGGNDTATGLANTALGLGSLTSQSTGVGNSAFGVNAGRNISTASSNTAIGTNTMMNGNIGNANTAVGGNALSGPGTLTENTAIGMASMARYTASSTDNASGNTALGFGSLAYIFNGIGNVGLGKRSMGGLLSGVNNIAIGNMTADNLVGGSNNVYIGDVKAFSTSSNNELNINKWIVGNNGTIGIGQFTNQLPADGVAADGEKYKLFVKDGIKTEKIKVDIAASNGWADYVFEKNYKLMPLNELDNFINKNGHLPEVPTTKEAIEKGIELKEMNILLLKKIEELTLYTIEQQKRIETLEKKMK